MFEFRVNNIALDISPDTNWERVLTNSRYNVQELQLSFSVPITIPNNDHNNKLLGHPSFILSKGNKAFNGKIWYSGQPLFDASLVILKSYRKTSEVSFFAGERSLEVIETKLRDIPWPQLIRSQLNLTHNPDHDADNAVQGFFGFPLTRIQDGALFDPQLYTFEDFNRYDFDNSQHHPVNMPLPFIFTKPVIKYYLNHFGYSVEGNFFNTAAGNKLSSPSNYYLDGATYKDTANAPMQAKVNQDTNLNLGVVYNIPTAQEVADPLNAFDNGAGRYIYTIKYPGTYTFRYKDIQIKVDKTGGIGPQLYNHFLGFIAAGEVILSDFTGENVDSNGLNKFYTSPLYQRTYGPEDVGKTIVATIQVEGLNTEHLLRPNNPVNLEVTAIPEDKSRADDDPNFTVAEFLPDITFGAYITELQQIPGISVTFEALRKAVRIDFESDPQYIPKIKNFTPFVGREIEISNVDEDGFSINYSYPEDHFNSPPTSPEIIASVLDEFEIASISNPKIKRGVLVRGTNQIAIYTDNDGNYELYDNILPFIVGNGKIEIKPNHHPIKMIVIDTKLFLPQPLHDNWRSEFNEDEYVSPNIQFGFYYGLSGEGYQEATLNNYPYCSPFNYDALNNKLLDFNLFMHDAEGIKEYHLKSIYIDPKKTKQILLEYLLPFSEVMELNETDIIWCQGARLNIKEAIIPFGPRGFKSIQILHVKPIE